MEENGDDRNDIDPSQDQRQVDDGNKRFTIRGPDYTQSKSIFITIFLATAYSQVPNYTIISSK